MAEQTIEERLNELKQKQDHVGDPFGANDLRTLVEGIEYAMSHGGDVSVAVTPVENGYKITVTDSEGNLQEATVQNGGDAYAVYVSTVPEGQTPMNKTEWLASLKGATGDNGHNPCLGRFTTLPTLSPNPFEDAQTGDYLYYDTTDQQTSDPVTYIYHFDGEDWDSGTVIDAEHPTLASGQAVTSVHIKDENGDDDSNAQGVLSAEAGKRLGDEVFGTDVVNEMPTNQRLDDNTTLVSSYSDGWAAWTSNPSLRSITVNKVDGYFAVDIDSSTYMVYCGLRTEVLPEMVLGEAYIASFYAKNKDGNTTPIAFFVRTIGGRYELSRIVLTDDWVKYELEFVYSPEQVTRFQIGNVVSDPYAKDAISFYVKDFALVKVNGETKKGLVERVGALENAMGDVVYKTEALSDLKGKVVAVLGDSISTNGVTGVNSNVPEIAIGQNDVGVELSAYLTYYDVQGGLTINGHTFTSDEIGTEVTFTPAIGDVGKVIGKPNNYNDGSLKVWWEVMNEMLGTSVIPVCWSGSSITSHEESNNLYKCSYAWHDSQIKKCGVRVEGSMDRIAPDIIIIYRGTNDFSHVAGIPNTYARLTDGYFDAVGFQYPATDVLNDGKWGFKEGLVLTISKLRTAYPHAKIFICTLNVFKRISYAHFPTNNGINTLPQYNNAIREVADYMGCGVIEFDKDGITFENCYPTYISDSATIPTHPNYKGHLVMGRKAALDMVCQYSDMA